MVRNVEPSAGRVPITPPQQISQRTLTQLERQLDDAIARRATALEILLAGVQVIDSAGLNWLLTVKSRLEVAGIELVLVEPSAIVSDILMATRLDERFTIRQAGGGARNA